MRRFREIEVIVRIFSRILWFYVCWLAHTRKATLKVLKVFQPKWHFQQTSLILYSDPAGNYMFKVDYRITRTRCQICSKLTIKTPEWRRVNAEQVNAGWMKREKWVNLITPNNQKMVKHKSKMLQHFRKIFNVCLTILWILGAIWLNRFWVVWLVKVFNL